MTAYLKKAHRDRTILLLLKVEHGKKNKNMLHNWTTLSQVSGEQMVRHRRLKKKGGVREET